MSGNNDVYAFVFKGTIAQDSINREIKSKIPDSSESIERIIKSLPFDLLDADYIHSARKMAEVYTAINSFENLARKFINDRLLEECGANWWEEKVPVKIRNDAESRKKEEELHRYHGSRGSSMIYYTQMEDLISIIGNNFEAFEAYIPNVDWVRQLFKSISRSRNVIMHSGELNMNDIVRVGVNIRDWLQQVGG